MRDTISYSGMLDKAEADELLAFARELADVSAAVIRPYFRTGYQVEIKADASPVTIADRRAEEVMRELIVQRYPDHGVLGEEFGDPSAGRALSLGAGPHRRDQGVCDAAPISSAR